MIIEQLYIGAGRSEIQRIFPESPHAMTVDVDGGSAPDLVAQITDLSAFADESVANVVVHGVLNTLAVSEVPLALSEVRRILIKGGRATFSVFNVTLVAKSIIENGLSVPIYQDKEKIWTALDILYGQGIALSAGNDSKAHHCAFDVAMIENLLARSGFRDIEVTPESLHNGFCGEVSIMDEIADRVRSCAQSIDDAIRRRDESGVDLSVNELRSVIAQYPSLRDAIIAYALQFGLLNYLIDADDRIIGTLPENNWASGAAGLILLIQYWWNNRFSAYKAEGYFLGTFFEPPVDSGKSIAYLREDDLLQRSIRRLRQCTDDFPDWYRVRLLLADACLRNEELPEARAAYPTSVFSCDEARSVNVLLEMYFGLLFQDRRQMLADRNQVVSRFARRLRGKILIASGGDAEGSLELNRVHGQQLKRGKLVGVESSASIFGDDYRRFRADPPINLKYDVIQRGERHPVDSVVRQATCFSLTMRKARILDDHGTVSSSDGIVIDETLFTNLPAYPEHWPYIERLGDKTVRSGMGYRPINVDEPVVFVGIGQCRQHYSWVTEVVPRILTSEQNGLANDRKYLLFGPLHKNHFELLGLLGLPYEKFLIAPENTSPLVDDMILVCASRHEICNVEMLRTMQRIMMQKFSAVENGSRFIFLSRKKVDRRRLVNEDELAEVCVERGAEIVYPEELSVAEQIRIFTSSDIIVSPAGAALVTGCLVAPSKKFISLQNSVSVGAPHPMALTELGHKYRVVTGANILNRHDDFVHWQYHVSPEDLMKALDEPWG